jgi:16S rRNA (guanine527-N7)-methyltransferase
MTSLIKHYFPEVSEAQIEKYTLHRVLMLEWNNKINLISRKDIADFELHHQLHSLAICKVIRFVDGTKIIDIGTGGGFPGIPLAIFYPNCQFTLVDSIGKKIMVVQDVIQQLELKNVRAIQQRGEEIKEKFDFVTNRAVAPVADIMKWTQKLIATKHINAMPNGILCLKGGDLREEIKEFKKYSVLFPIKDYFKESFFDTKSVVYVQG